MANEIRITGTLGYIKGTARAQLSGSIQASQVGDKYEAGIQTVGTVEESLQKGDIGTIGWCAVRNMDDTNFVQLGSTTGVYSVKLMPGEYVQLRWNGTTMYAKADTAACDVEYLLIEA